MRRFTMLTALALGSAALWGAMPQPVTQPVSTDTSPAMSRAYSLCRAQQGIRQTCVAALMNALVTEQAKQVVTATADRACHTEHRTFSRDVPS
jgi:hypothetical protein